jgi:hypothetical protein
MWIREYKKRYTGVTKADLWRIQTDINNWHTWHDDLEYCKLDEDFAVGNYFILKPKGMKAVKIMLTEVIPGRQFTDCTSFFGAKMYDTHSVEETADGGVLLSHKVVVTGPLKWLWIKLVAQNVADTVPEEIDNLVKLARKLHV